MDEIDKKERNGVYVVREEKIKKRSAIFKYDRVLRLTSEPRLI